MHSGLIIFIRNPIHGQVKTRLAKTMGDEKALQIYKMLLAHTHDVTKDLSCDTFLYYSSHIEINDFWENDLFQKRMQSIGDLGIKMSNAFGELFKKGYQRLVIIGSDCIELDSPIIEKAFHMLEHKEVVIGPSKDGGYYLLGMKSFLPFLFSGKQWSSSSVLKDTIRDLEDAGISYEELPLLNDIDEERDIPSWLMENLTSTYNNNMKSG